MNNSTHPIERESVSLLTELLNQSKTYHNGSEFLELLDFVNQLSNFAPFNAMLLHIQKPGIRFAASKYDWERKFSRSIKEDARPLLILWPFAPVALVYDVADTEGAALPDAVAEAFRATGDMTAKRIQCFITQLKKHRLFEYGDGKAGYIKRPEHDLTAKSQSKDSKEKPDYLIRINQTHNANVQFVTLAHELAHLFLGHLGADKFLKITDRSKLLHQTRELEAESVCYIVCRRNNVLPNSEAYLTSFVNKELEVEDMDVYALMKAAGQIETLLELAVHTKFS